MARGGIFSEANNKYLADFNQRSRPKSPLITPVEKRRKNRGSGLGYIAASAASGLAGVFEGAADLVVGTAALFSGDKAYAQHVFEDSKVGEWKRNIDVDYNPSGFMEFMGQAAQGVGQSSTFLIPQVGAGLFFTGVIGGSTGEAVQKTGNLGLREYVYGVAAGATEGAMELVTDAGAKAARVLYGKAAKSAGFKVLGKLGTKVSQWASASAMRGVLKDFVSNAAGEFVEEFLEDYTEVAWQRITGVDPEASTTLADAMYSGLVAAVSGSFMGGVASGINVARHHASGKRVMENGNVDAIVKTAEMVSESFKSEKDSKLPPALSDLKQTLKAYNNLADKTSSNAAIMLGRMKADIFYTQAYSGVQKTMDKIKTADMATFEKYAAYMSYQTGQTYSAMDFIQNKDQVMELYAIEAWSSLFLSDSQAQSDMAGFRTIIDADKAATAAQAAPVVRNISEAVNDSGEGWDGSDAVFKTQSDIRQIDRDYRRVVENDITAEGGTTVTAEGADAPAPESEIGYIRVKKLGDDAYSISWGADAENMRGFKSRTEAEVRRLLGQISKADSELVQSYKAFKASEADTSAGESIPSDEIKKTYEKVIPFIDAMDSASASGAELNTGEVTYSAAEQDTARKAVKGFDTLDPDTRRAVLDWIRSAEGQDSKMIRAISSIIAARPGLHVLFAELGEGHKGLYTDKLGEGRRLVVVDAEQAGDAVMQTITHELTHDLESTDGYSKLKKAALRGTSEARRLEIIDMYVKKCGAEQTYSEFLGDRTGTAETWDEYLKQYPQIDGEAISAEIVAKAVGDKLGKVGFIDKYASTNILSSGWNWLKRLYKSLKADRADELALGTAVKLGRAFEKALGQARSAKSGAGTSAYDIAESREDKEYRKPITQSDIQKIRDIAAAHGGDRVSINDFTSEDIKATQKWAHKFYKELGAKSPFFRAWFGDWRAYDRSKINTVTVNNIDLENVVMQNGDYSNADTGWSIRAGSLLYGDTMSHARGEKISVKALNDIENILKNAVLFNTILSERDKSKKSSGTAFMHKLYCPITYKGELYIAKITVEEYLNAEDEKVKRRGYNLRAIKIEAVNGSLTDTRSATAPVVESASINSISDLHALVKRYDKEFSPKPVNPVFLNEDGTPKVFYHGSNYHGIRHFDTSTRGIYFTESIDYAKIYTRKKGLHRSYVTSPGEIYACYINIKKPLDTRSKDIRKLVENELDIGNSKQDIITDIGLPHAVYAEELSKVAQKFGYDGLILDEIGYGSNMKERVSYVVFSPEQIKSATGNIGTFDRSNPDIRYDLDENAADNTGNGKKSYSNSKKYSYDSLTAKKELPVVNITAKIPVNTNGATDYKAIIAIGKKNARKENNLHNTKTSTYVYVPDIKRDVLIGANGLKHGLPRSRETALAVMNIGDILRNSFAVNELNASTSRATDMSYVLLGAFRDSKNIYAVRTVVSKQTNNVTEFDIYQLGAVKGKKIETPDPALKRGAAVTEQSSLISSESPTVSISNFLQAVKNISLINEVFSNDVAAKLNVTRSNGDMSRDIRYDLAEGQKAQGSENGKNDNSSTTDESEMRKQIRKDNEEFAKQNRLKYFKNSEASYLSFKLRKEFRIKFKHSYTMSDMIHEAFNTYNAWGVDDAKHLAEQLAGDISEAYLQELRDRGTAPAMVNNISGELHNYNDTIATLIFNAYIEGGTTVKSAEQIEALKAKHAEQIKKKTERTNETKNAAFAAGKVIADARRLKDYAGYTRSSGILANSSYSQLVKDGSRVVVRYNVNVKKAREWAALYVQFVKSNAPELFNLVEAKSKLEQLLTDSNASLESINTLRDDIVKLEEAYQNSISSPEAPTISNFLDDKVVANMKSVAEGEGAMNAAELNATHRAMSGIITMSNRVDRIWRADGTTIDAVSIVDEELSRLDSRYAGKESPFKGRPILAAVRDFQLNGMIPIDVMRTLEGTIFNGKIQDGAMAEAIKELNDASIRADSRYGDYIEPFQEFEREHKSWWKRFNNDEMQLTVNRVLFDGSTQQIVLPLTVDEAISIYMTSKRQQAQAALELGRVEIEDADRKGDKWRNRLIEGSDISYTASEQTASEISARNAAELNAAIGNLKKQFTSEDWEYIKLLEHFFANESKNDKRDMDMKLFGKSNVLEGYYFTIFRSVYSRYVDMIGKVAEYNNPGVRKFSWNQRTIEGANARLTIKGARKVTYEHAAQLAMYVEMTEALQNLNTIYNYKSTDKYSNVNSIREYLGRYVWSGTDNYLTKLVADTQKRTPARTDALSRSVRYLTGAAARSSLGLNPWSMIKQFTTYIMTMRDVPFAIWCDGFKVRNRKKIDDYCISAKIRNNDQVMLEAQNIRGKIDKVTGTLMAPLKFGDRSVCLLIWTQAQYEAAKTYGLPLDSEENLKKAGELASARINMYNDTSTAPSKSAMARSQSEVAGAFAIFRSAPEKMFGLLSVSAQQMADVVKMSKNNETVSPELKNKVIKNLAQVSALIIAATVFESVIGVLRSKLRGYDDDEEENTAKQIAIDASSSLLGLVPVIGQIGESLISGYDTNLIALDALNDAGDAITGTWKIVKKSAFGENVTTQEASRAIRNTLYSIGQVTGMPVKNAGNIIKCALSVLSPTMAYKTQSIFYSPTTADVKKAIDSGNTRMAETAMRQLMLYSKTGSRSNARVNSEMTRLYAAGYTNAVPRSTPIRTTVDGEDKSLTAKQTKQFEQIYHQADNAAAQLVSTADYAALTDEQKAKALRGIYDIYYSRAAHAVLGADLATASALSYFTDDVPELVTAAAYMSGLKTDSDGKRADKVRMYVSEYPTELQPVLLWACGQRSASVKSRLSKLAEGLPEPERTAVTSALKIDT